MPTLKSISETKAAATSATPLSDLELDSAIESLQRAAAAGEHSLNWAALRALLSRAAHLPHKEWSRTEAAADDLAALVGEPADAAFGDIFHRVLADGNWAEAERAATSATGKPWVVLVTGVNGIRKTSSIYQPWFQEALSQALAEADLPADELPTGANSFFRQLDYMIATVASEDFCRLYELDDVAVYAACKDAIFARWRTLAEMLGASLVKASRARRMNVMVETSGRDIAMFKYVDYFFPDDTYNKLVVHFTVNDLGFAERSVDTRMLGEMAAGRAALGDGAVREIIKANAGGPYGSAVLRGVQTDSDAVWESVRSGASGVAGDWRKARIAITAREDGPWTAQAVPADAASPADSFAFGPPRS